MMFSQGLSLDQAPPLGAPYLFFITAPLFGMLAGAILLLGEPSAFSARATMPFLASAHALFIGFIAMAMAGAMQQMLPVIAGARFPRPLLNARLIYLPLAAGTLLLVLGFYRSDPVLLKGAMGLLFFAFSSFIVLAGYALAGVKEHSDSVRAFGLAFASLAIALFFALAVGLAYAGVVEYRPAFAQLHMAWVFFGWIILLVIGVSFQVVPMFYVAEAYNPFCRKKGVFLIFVGLLIFSGVTLFFPWANGVAGSASLLLIAALVLGYAVVTILRLKRRKRAVRDTNIRFWYLAMGSLILGTVVWLFGYFSAEDATMTGGGIVLAIGFLVSLISAMLYKIVPFLVWFHLTNSGHFGVATMRELIAERWIKVHFYVHAGALGAFMAAGFISPWFYPLAGGVFLLSNGLFFANLAKAGLYYCKKKSEPVMGMELFAQASENQ